MGADSGGVSLASYSNGPDVMDLEVAMRAVGALHSGEVKVTITPHTGSVSGGLHIDLCMSLTVLPGSSLPKEVHAWSEWPCPGCKDFVQHLYAGVVALDWEMEKAYNQLPLQG